MLSPETVTQLQHNLLKIPKESTPLVWCTGGGIDHAASRSHYSLNMWWAAGSLLKSKMNPTC